MNIEKIKVLTASDILAYLVENSKKGVCNINKKQIATHFGYKTSNGNGFLKNFELLQKHGCIKKLKTKGKGYKWKILKESIDEEAIFEIENLAKNKIKDSVSIKTKHILVQPVEGVSYVSLTDLGTALGIDNHSVYNAGAKTNGEVCSYTAMISFNGAKPRKAIAIDGLDLLLGKLLNKVSSVKLRRLSDFIKAKAGVEDDDFNESNNTSNESECSNVCNSASTGDEILCGNSINGSFSELNASLDDILGVLKLHGEYKIRVGELERELYSLKQENDTLKREMVEKNSSLTELQSKVNIIRRYVDNSKVAN